MRQLARGLEVLALFVLISCSTGQFIYVPAGNPIGGKTGWRQALYNIPQEKPSGTLRVMSEGVVNLKPKAGNGEKIKALHIRMTASNQGAAPWTIDVKEQTVSFPNRGQVGPVYANSDSESMPSLEIPAGQLKTLDLYFPLPDDVKRAKDLPQFDFRWKVGINGEVVAATTAFDRYHLEHYHNDYPDYYGYPYGYGPYIGYGASWWWGPPVWYYGGPGIRVRH